MGWAKHEDAVKANHKALLESYGQLVKLLSRGCTDSGLALSYCHSLVTHVKMRDSLRRNTLQSQPIDIEKVLQALPPTSIVLRRKP